MQVEPVGDGSEEADRLAEACQAALGGWAPTGAVPAASMARELLLGGWLAQHYLRCAD